MATGLNSLGLAGTYSTGDHAIREFYLPALSASCGYDRMAGYYSSSVLRLIAVGMVSFIRNAQQHNGRMRLIVGTQLSAEDVQAVREGMLHRDSAIAEATRRTPLAFDGDEIGDEHFKILGYMIREGLLEVKVGVPLDADGHPLTPEEAKGYFHSKYGLLTDASGDRVAFLGSENETASGWLYNHETFTVAKSWLEQVWEEQGRAIAARFEAHWNNNPDHGWAVLPLEDIDDRLLKMVPQDYAPPAQDPIWKFLEAAEPVLEPTPAATQLDSEASARAWAELQEVAAKPVRDVFEAALTAPASPLPHQSRLLHRAVTTFPRGYLFADPVGFGKTVELGLTIRELLLSGRAKSVLILVPASVLRQWQEELAEKMGLLVPRYENGQFLDLQNEPVVAPANANPWSAFPIVLASSHLARRRARRAELLQAGPWDVVVVDEAHHARRRGSKATDSPNSLLSLLLDMRKAEKWEALYLATATPMQMNPHEAWDLIELLGLPGKWANSAADFMAYFEQLRKEPSDRGWAILERMLDDYFSDPASGRDSELEQRIKAELGAAKAKKITSLNTMGMPAETASNLSPLEAKLMDEWLRRHTPMKDRVFRNTRDTLRTYQAAGIIPAEVTIPERHVNDEFIALDDWEQKLYERIEQYIRRYYNAYITDASTQPLGFIMTVYRRRLTSSFYAIRQSLKRRLDALERGLTLGDLLADDDRAALEEDALFEVDTEAIRLDLLRGEIAELKSFVEDLEAITGEDTKATQLMKDLTNALGGYSSVVVFTQYTDTMDYVRTRLVTAGYLHVGCYSGRGGELWIPETKTWQTVTKERIKTLFRNDELDVLIGTDSMSEGLNLQTSGRLINYDMPWNLMRAEQRAGRVDRIGAKYHDIQVTNYFYADTVEEAVYRGIAEDYGDFTELMGSAQPVLGSIEQAIERLAMQAEGTHAQKAERARDAIKHLKDEIASANNQAVLLKDLGDAPGAVGAAATPTALDLPEELTDLSRVTDLKAVLLHNPLLAHRFRSLDDEGLRYSVRTTFEPERMSFGDLHAGSAQALLSSTGGALVEVTFDRKYAEDHPAVTFLSYGSPVLDTLLPASTCDLGAGSLTAERNFASPE